MKYRVTALDKHGKELAVDIEAENKNQAALKAKNDGLSPFRIISEYSDNVPNKKIKPKKIATILGFTTFLMLVIILSVLLPDTSTNNKQNTESTKKVKTKPPKPEPVRIAVGDTLWVASFPVEVTDIKNTIHTGTPQVVIELETSVKVAKKMTEDDIAVFWEKIKSSFRNKRVFLRFWTTVPGTGSWAVVTRLNTGKDFAWEENISINEYNIDPEPYYFANKIDRNIEEQNTYIVALPMVNRVDEILTRLGWDKGHRDEAFYTANVKLPFNGSKFPTASITLTPESVGIDSYHIDINDFLSLAEMALLDLGIFPEIKEKLFSVIGSPKYINVKSGMVVMTL
ncbi:MAG: hypothetical protein PVG39_22370 [Desulfobacteraceae bacterium]